jgi:ubiquinone/menaquinone biosynthesis C-methylase UbiE
MSAVRELFAAAAGRYARANTLLLIERPETAALLPPLAGRDVLDLGAGNGHYAALARDSGARRALALDLTPEMLAAAPRPALQADAGRLPLRDGCLDVVVAALLVSFVADRTAVFREVARVLRRGGCLVLSDLHAVAARLGWRRSFEGPAGERLVIEAPPPRPDQLADELAVAGLEVEARREPVIDERLAPGFRRAGRSDFASLRGTPLLVVLRARKGGR